MNEPRLWRVAVKETTNALRDTVRLANGTYWTIGKATEMLIVAPSVADVERIIGVANIESIVAEGVCLVLGLNEPKADDDLVEIGDMPKDVAKVLLQNLGEPSLVTKAFIETNSKRRPRTSFGGSGNISVDIEGGVPIKCEACKGKKA